MKSIYVPVASAQRKAQRNAVWLAPSQRRLRSAYCVAVDGECDRLCSSNAWPVATVNDWHGLALSIVVSRDGGARVGQTVL